MMYYTSKGDDGTTGLFGSKERQTKSGPIFEVLGGVDELNSYLGVCKAVAENVKESVIGDIMAIIQERLFIIQAELAGSDKQILDRHTQELEAIINKISKKIPKIKSFTIPGATELSAHIDYARTLARKSERMIVRLGDTATTRELRQFMNRLSSLLFVMARYASHLSGQQEQSPKY